MRGFRKLDFGPGLSLAVAADTEVPRQSLDHGEATTRLGALLGCGEARPAISNVDAHVTALAANLDLDLLFLGEIGVADAVGDEFVRDDSHCIERVGLELETLKRLSHPAQRIRMASNLQCEGAIHL